MHAAEHKCVNLKLVFILACFIIDFVKLGHVWIKVIKGKRSMKLQWKAIIA